MDSETSDGPHTRHDGTESERRRMQAKMCEAARPATITRLRLATMMTPFMTATPNRRDEADAGRDVEGDAGEVQRDQSAERRQRHDAKNEHHLAQPAELRIEFGLLAPKAVNGSFASDSCCCCWITVTEGTGHSGR
jgi:hypothetical protein